MKSVLIIFLVFFATFSNSKAQSSLGEPTDVSLINLIAAPERYNGKLVRILGYLNLEFEGNALYLHKEDYDNSLFKNGVWIDLPRKEAIEKTKEFSKRYVIIEGVFDMNNTGHMALFSGSITKITRLDLWRDYRH
jgi:hypothetical protein